jgi:hypothetical protein
VPEPTMIFILDKREPSFWRAKEKRISTNNSVTKALQ